MAASLFYSILWAALIALDLMLARKLFKMYQTDKDVQKLRIKFRFARTRLRGVAIDITDRKRVEENLQAKDELILVNEKLNIMGRARNASRI